MASLEEIRKERLRKLEILKSNGIDPYPISAHYDVTVEDAIKKFSKLSKKKSVRMVGRVIALRGQGAIFFFDFDDGTGKFQGMLRRGETSEKEFSRFGETVDIGDFIEIKGKFFFTKKKEKTILVNEWRMLAKSLRPIPDKWHGLENVEERFRRRYLDILTSNEVRERFILRSKIISESRNFLEENGYIEVETPILQHLAGGAAAEPFKTRHHALETDLYLRIAPELYLKELLIGGFRKVYELGRNFRNEGIDVTHNPEFTMLEFYEAYSDALKQMAFVERFIRTIVKRITKKNFFVYDGKVIDVGKKFNVVSYLDLIKRYALIPNPLGISREELRVKAEQLAIRVESHDAPEKIMDNIYKKSCRPKLINPTFIVDYPVAFSPFAKRLESNKEFIDRFQLVIGGLEVVNAFSELNDPLDQRERYLEQDKKRQGGEADISPLDETYLEAMEYGMPPAGGVGVGIDRLVMLLSNVKNIREVLLFPTLRPRG